MYRKLAITALAVVVAGVGELGEAHALRYVDAPRVAQLAPPASPAPTAADRAAGRVSALENQLARVDGTKQRLAATHQKQLAEVDRLKRRRPSWRRDRQLASALADAKQTADALGKVDRQRRAIARRLLAAKRELYRSARAEWQGASSGRRVVLRGWLRRSRSAVASRRKITLPDASIDPLADPEDLEYQAQRIARVERQLATELRDLSLREQRYERMVRLRSKASRAVELAQLDGDQPRRSAGRGADSGNAAESPSSPASDDAAGGGGPESPAPSPDPAGDPSDGPAGDPAPDSDAPTRDPGPTEGLGASAAVLADVVDAPTLGALRRAETSSNPRTKAAAMGRARSQVEAQLERLRQARKAIEARARTLRGK